MIDYRTFKKFHPDSPDLDPPFHSPLPYDTWPSTLPHDAQLSDLEVLLLPPIIHGFILKQKNWCKKYRPYVLRHVVTDNEKQHF